MISFDHYEIVYSVVLIELTAFCLCNLMSVFQNLMLQGEMQTLRDKLTVTERAAKSEAMLKVIIRSNKWVCLCDCPNLVIT